MIGELECGETLSEQAHADMLTLVDEVQLAIKKDNIMLV